MKSLHIAAVGLLILILSAAPSLAQCGGMGHGSHQGHQQHQNEDAASITFTEPIAAYPLDYCLITGEQLGTMGNPVIRTYNSRQINFCCDQCPATFEQDQERYLAQHDAAIIEGQVADYPLGKCVVSDEKLGSMGNPYDYVYNNELVRFCCVGCVPKFQQDPHKYLKKLHKASGNKAVTSPSEHTDKPASEHSRH